MIKARVANGPVQVAADRRSKDIGSAAADVLVYSEEVETALTEGRPVVALETTIVTHGMPYPQNVETAHSVEAVIRTAGAVPATICVRDGALRVGMSADEIEQLAQTQDVVKASRRDLAVALATSRTASTTVAATMMAAQLAGIRTFVTGGIGGVHRGATETMDVSADLYELAKTEVMVVCAGAKAILDIGLTLEVLETLGVPVLGYGTDRFPAFYTADSGHPAAYRVDSPDEVAAIARTQWTLGWSGGLLVANPIPKQHALSPAQVDAAVASALAQAAARKVSGKAVTPFLLAEVEKQTSGKSLAANIRLIEHNAAVGAGIAKAYAALEREFN